MRLPWRKSRPEPVPPTQQAPTWQTETTREVHQLSNQNRDTQWSTIDTTLLRLVKTGLGRQIE